VVHKRAKKCHILFEWSLRSYSKCIVWIGLTMVVVFAPTSSLVMQRASNFKIFLYFRLQVTLPENDSQNNSGLSRSNLKSYRASLTVKEIADIDGVLKDCGLPTCDSFPLTSESFTKALELSWRHQTEKISFPWRQKMQYLKTWLFICNEWQKQSTGLHFRQIFCYLSYPSLELSLQEDFLTKFA